MVTVRVIAPFTHDGVARRPGESITVAVVDAAILARRRLVSLTRDVEPAPAEAPAAPESGRRRYKRRDLVAEP